jgi:hypothetical protein
MAERDDEWTLKAAEICGLHRFGGAGLVEGIASALRSAAERSAGERARQLHAAKLRATEAETALARAMFIVDANIDWQTDDGTCNFCGYEQETRPHDEDCPLVENGFIDSDGRRKGGGG